MVKKSPHTRKTRNSRFSLVCLFCCLLVLTQMIPAAARAVTRPTPEYERGTYNQGNDTIVFGYDFGEYNTPWNFDIQGFYGTWWKRTTNKDYGYRTYMKIGDVVKHVTAAESGWTFEDNSNNNNDLAEVRITASFPQPKVVKITYAVENLTSSAMKFSLGTGCDVKIGSDDYAAIAPVNTDIGKGLKMVSDSDIVNGVPAQFTFIGSGNPAVTNVSHYWYGRYSTWSGDEDEAVDEDEVVFYTASNIPDTSESYDSAMSWHWADQTLAAHETKEYSVLICIGGEGSDAGIASDKLSNATGSVMLNLNTPATSESDFTLTTSRGHTLTPGADYTVYNPTSTQPVIQFTENARVITCETSTITVSITNGDTVTFPVTLEHTDANGHNVAQRPAVSNPGSGYMPPLPGVPAVSTTPPKTGDSAPLTLWLALTAASGCLLLFLLWRRKAAKHS